MMPSALFLPRGHQPFPRALQVRGELDGVLAEAYGVRGDADLACQIVKQASLTGGESVLTGAAAEYQLTNGFAAVQQR